MLKLNDPFWCIVMLVFPVSLPSNSRKPLACQVIDVPVFVVTMGSAALAGDVLIAVTAPSGHDEEQEGGQPGTGPVAERPGGRPVEPLHCVVHEVLPFILGPWRHGFRAERDDAGRLSPRYRGVLRRDGEAITPR
jgi:hypothetical protein